MGSVASSTFRDALLGTAFGGVGLGAEPTNGIVTAAVLGQMTVALAPVTSFGGEFPLLHTDAEVPCFDVQGQLSPYEEEAQDGAWLGVVPTLWDPYDPAYSLLFQFGEQLLLC